MGGGAKLYYRGLCYVILAYTYNNPSSSSRILVRRNLGQNFVHEFLSSTVLQWLRQNFSSEGTFSKIGLIKDFFKVLKKIYKKFAQRFKTFSKIFQK